jgi:hypothetical protein
MGGVKCQQVRVIRLRFTPVPTPPKLLTLEPLICDRP